MLGELFLRFLLTTLSELLGWFEPHSFFQQCGITPWVVDGHPLSPGSLSLLGSLTLFSELVLNEGWYSLPLGRG